MPGSNQQGMREIMGRPWSTGGKRTSRRAPGLALGLLNMQHRTKGATWEVGAASQGQKLRAHDRVKEMSEKVSRKG